MSSTVYLVSGANRGIGLGIVKALVQRDSVIVFAGTRNTSTSTELLNIERAHPDKFHVVKLVSADKMNNEAAVSEIKAKVGRLDVVIANAGINNAFALGTEVTPEQMRTHYEVNVLGPLLLFQASWTLLKSSTDKPKFVSVSSVAGTMTIGGTFPHPLVAYGASKAALNFVTRKLYTENSTLITFPICPGGVDTDMGTGFRKGMKETGFDLHAQGLPVGITIEQSAADVLRELDMATRETHGEVLIRAQGGKYEW